MPLFVKHILKRSGAAVVDQGVAPADALLRRRVEPMVPLFGRFFATSRERLREVAGRLLTGKAVRNL